MFHAAASAVTREGISFPNPAERNHSAAFDAGMRVRRSVLGDAYVERAIAATTEFADPFQDFITRTTWGDVWSRPRLDNRTRPLLTLALLTPIGNSLPELAEPHLESLAEQARESTSISILDEDDVVYVARVPV